jgi:hypothetical protein
MQDPERWKRLETAAPAKPVRLYPRPTVFSAHPVISLTREADELIDALMNEAMLELAWEDHGFRGPLGTIGKTQSPLLHTRMLDSIDAVLPMPEAAAMMALIDHSAA